MQDRSIWEADPDPALPMLAVHRLLLEKFDRLQLATSGWNAQAARNLLWDQATGALSIAPRSREQVPR